MQTAGGQRRALQQAGQHQARLFEMPHRRLQLALLLADHAQLVQRHGHRLVGSVSVQGTLHVKGVCEVPLRRLQLALLLSNHAASRLRLRAGHAA